MPIPKERQVCFHKLIKDFGGFSKGDDLPKDEVIEDGGGMYTHAHKGDFVREPIRAGERKFLVGKALKEDGIFENSDGDGFLSNLKEV